MTVRDWIEAEGITRDEAAARLGITRRHLEPLITRYKSPSLALAQRIISASGGRITVHDLSKVRSTTLESNSAAAA